VFYRNARQGGPLDEEASIRLNWLLELIQFAEAMVLESGNTEDFNGAAWAVEWLRGPQSAWGGASPADSVAEEAGRDRVINFLRQIQGGVYL
jgi:hypothetical protein